MTAPPAVDAVRAALPQERERPADQYPIDGATPALAVRPQTREELAALLAAAADAGLAIAPQGGRTALALGRPLSRYDIALDVLGLDRVVAHEPDDLTVTVEAGMTLEALQTRLAEHGQYLSVDRRRTTLSRSEGCWPRRARGHGAATCPGSATWCWV